ncbi:MAG: TIGR00730 family Rossman fold protein [Octadecabacter sp.]|nr:TIGR00730 family Rossman fold protein [Octadecabacter sp.]
MEDKDAPARVAATLNSPGYLQADQDVAFLGSDEMRGVRLQLDFMKAENGLTDHEVKHTVVVFGSTRIPEPAAARVRLEQARKKLDAYPNDPSLKRAVSIAHRVLKLSRYYAIAQEFGDSIGRMKEVRNGGRIALMTGGGPGMMEAANRGAFHAGTKSIGLNITLPHEQYPNPYLTPGLCFRFHYFALRKMHFLNRARALVAFPGGYGTMDELFETLTLVQTRKIAPLPIILVGREFWSRAVDIPYLVEEGVIDPEDEELFGYAETSDEILQIIADWYAKAGEPFIEKPSNPSQKTSILKT